MGQSISRVRFIVNPSAGRGKGDIGALIRDVLDRTEVDFEILWTQRVGHAEALAREGAEEGFGIVVAAGGDGTVHEVATGLLDTEAGLGILPCGSGNGLARALGVPLDLRLACRLLPRARFRRIDVGRLGRRPFFATAGMGLDALVASRFRDSRRRGMVPYFFLTAQAFLTHKPEEVQLSLDGDPPMNVRPFLLVLANTAQYGGGALIAPGARPDDGLLEVCLIEDLTLLRGIVHARRLFTGTLSRMPGVRFFRAARVRIVRSEAGPIQVDGEALPGEAVLEASVQPAALQVAIP